MLTTTLRRAAAPGNVLLEGGEGGLPQHSVVNVSQLDTIARTDLQEYIGRLARSRVHEIIAGIRLVIEPRDVLTDEGE